MGYLNIHGLDVKGINKLDLPLIQKYICGHSIFCLAETWLKDDKKLFSFDGYTTYNICRKLGKKKKGHASGGFLVFVKDQFSNKISIVKRKASNFIVWCKIERNFEEEDLYI